MVDHTLHRRKKSLKRRQRSMLLVIGSGVALLMIGLLAIAGGGDSSADRNDFTLPTLDGDKITLSDYEGQVVLVNFWATWCPPCKAEMPMLHDYYQTYKDQGFMLLAVNVNEPASLAESFIAQTGYTFPVLLDTNGSISDQYNITGMPTSVIFDVNGDIVYRHSGMITADAMKAQVTPLLTK